MIRFSGRGGRGRGDEASDNDISALKLHSKYVSDTEIERFKREMRGLGILDLR